MFNLIKNKFIKNNVYEDISIVYDVVDVCDNYISIKRSNTIEQLHIYRVEPVTIINITETVSKNIISIYTEFLRNMNCDFQIYIENVEVNLSNYFNNITIDNSNINKNKLAMIYRNQLEKSLKQNSIYINNYYIAITINEKFDIREISKNINDLSRIGVFAEKLEGNEELNKFLYMKVNKVDNIC
jgi:hypothetical protein